MEKSVNPLLAAVIVVVVLGLLGGKFYFDGKALNADYPSHLATTPAGELVVRFQDKLVVGDGSTDKIIALAPLNAASGVGNISFFNNGDLLIRSGQRPLGLFERLGLWLREMLGLGEEQGLKEESEEGPPPAAKERAGHLHRCNLTTQHCQLFAAEAPAIAGAFWSLVTDDDRLMVSHTGQHRLSYYSAQGRELAQSTADYRYPNQLLMVDDQLWLADTNHHQLKRLTVTQEAFGQVEKVIELAQADYDWPTSLAKMAGHWWVLGKTNTLMGGALHRFDESWQYRETLTLPEGADPGMVWAWRDQLLVTDMAERRIYRFNADGEQLADLQWPQLQQVLVAGRDEAAYYQRWSFALLGLLVVLIAIGLWVGGRQATASLPSRGRLGASEQSLTISDPAIQWVRVAPKLRRQVYWLWGGGLFLIVTAVAILLSSVETGKGFNQADWEMLLILPVIFLISYVPVRMLLNQAIGVKDDLLILKRGSRWAAARGEDIWYRNEMLFVGDMLMNLGGGRGIFPKRELIEHVYPMLKQARELTALQSQGATLRQGGIWLGRHWLGFLLTATPVVGFFAWFFYG